MENEKIIILCSTLIDEEIYVSNMSTDKTIKTTPHTQLARTFPSQEAAREYVGRIAKNDPDIREYRDFKILHMRVTTLETIEPRRNPMTIIRGRTNDGDVYVARDKNYESKPCLTTNMSDAKCFFNDTEACQFFDGHRNIFKDVECPEVVTITESKGWRLD